MTYASVILLVLAAILFSRSKKMADPARAKSVSRVSIIIALAALVTAVIGAADIVQDHDRNNAEAAA